jgi:hypothetical protein
LTSTRSSASFDFVRQQLKICQKYHQCAGQVKLEEKTDRPARLLDLEAFEQSSNLQLIDTPIPCPSYLTLSHQWGKGLLDAGKTMKENLEERRDKIVLDELPGNFQEAIEIARAVPIRYLWIDALCIVQNSREDWATESTKMSIIYADAVFTIAASVMLNGENRCFNLTSRSQMELEHPYVNDSFPRVGYHQVIKNAYGHPSLLIWQPYYLASNYENRPSLLSSLPILTRGWIFQERFLSKRKVFYTPNQLVWECLETLTAEDGLLMDRTPLEALLNIPSPLLGPDLYNYWTDTAKAYSVLDFTFYSDRLIAIAGVARHLARKTTVDYVAGIWVPRPGGSSGLTEPDQVAFRSMLLWMSYSHNSTAPIPAEKLEGKFPTWSWAGCRYNLNFGNDLTAVSDLEAQNIVFELESYGLFFNGQPAARFGPIDSGHLTLRGTICPAKMKTKEGTFELVAIFPVDGQEMGAPMSASIDNLGYAGHLSQPLWCLDMALQDMYKRRMYMVLEEITGKDLEFTKMGFAYFSRGIGHSVESEKQWLDSGRRVVLVLH